MSVRIMLAGMSVLFLLTSLAQVPLPEDISLTPPSPSIAHGIAAFVGAWQGEWNDDFPTALVVEQICQDGKTRVVYSWGDLEMRGIKAGWRRQTGIILGGKLHLTSTNGASMDFTLEQNGNLFGQYKLTNGPPSLVELVRIPGTNSSIIIATASKPFHLWTEIQIPEHSQVGVTAGKTLMLQATLYRPPSPGRHPVVIFNHGSTGPGIIPASYVSRGGNETVFFRSLDYVVVVPMRKGRGASEGPPMEEDPAIPLTVGLNSAVEDLNAVVEYMDRQPYVDPARIMVAGVSRGGMLSVVYAGRYPTNVIGVINFSGGWFSEDSTNADFNFEAFREAGRTAKVPMLWLYADHDSLYSLNFDEREFAAFRSTGGRGELFEVRDFPGEGHFLVAWPGQWESKVADYLNGISKTVHQLHTVKTGD